MNAVFKSLAAAALLLSAATVARADDTELNFGVISTESTMNLKPLWDPFLADMAKETGFKVNAFFASDYAGVIEGMRFGKVQAAWFGNKSAMEAVDRAEGEIFAQSVAKDGSPGYWSLLIVPADSPLNSVEDVLKCDGSLNFGLGDPNSTSGYLVPLTFIFAKNGVDPKTCFKTVRNANHETNALAVANGQVDVAANNTENMERLKLTNPEAFKKIKVIWTSPLIPSDPIVWDKRIDQATKDKLLRFFMTYGRSGAPDAVAHQREILAGLQWAPFRPSSDAQLYPIRILQVSKKIFETQGDTTLSDADKAAKIKELETQKAAYEDLLGRVPQL